MDVKRRILEETFQHKFSMENMLEFSKEFLKDIKIVMPERENEDIPYEYRYTVASYRHIATYTTGKDILDVFVVKLRHDKSVERARSMQRSFISKLLSGANHDAALVAFYTDDEPRWRLSFVRLDYEFAAGRVKMSLTPAKRYSYLVGEKEPCHTALEQLYPIFEYDNFNPTLDRIEEAFSIESVTKEFFEKYREKYYDLKDCLDSDPAFIEESAKYKFTSEQFAKKLMGQLIFLYFLQKKGWLGVKAIPHTINEKTFKNAYYYSNACKILIPQVFKKTGDDEYRLQSGIIKNMSDNDTNIIAGCFHPNNVNISEQYRSGRWGNGSRTFVMDLFKRRSNKNFFNNFLEPMFYEALNINRGENNYYNRFNCKIPFLNGGLFEPINSEWRYTQFTIPDELFSNIADKGEREADGILDIFDRYNFTMYEDEPLEREVAVDPEMLGKIFENLLDSKDRKSKGAFYTPREIVHYMCQESLINYLINKTSVPYDDMKSFILDGEFIKDEDYNKRGQRRIPQSVFNTLSKIDEALINIRVADPAVGSGAFPLAVLNEIVKARNNITYYQVSMIENPYNKRRKFEERNMYDLKLKTIKNSIFAVDIEASAVDIAKLRLWLSLVVDEDLDPTEDDVRLGKTTQKDPRQLPNLDYNIMCGNSLIDEFEGIRLFDDGMFDTQYELSFDSMTDYLENLQSEQERLFDEQNSATKREIKKHIDDIIDNIIRYKLENENNTEGLKKYEENINQKTKPYFLWKLEFAKVFRENGGFDVVIGNPPYGANIDEMTELFEKLYPMTSKGFKDIYKYFFDCSISKLLNNNGILSFITPNTYFLQPRYKDLRTLLLKKNIIHLINLGENVFNAVVPTAISFIMNTSYKENYAIILLDATQKSKFNGSLYSLSSKVVYQSEFIDNSNHLFTFSTRNLNQNEVFLSEILEMKDGGFKYQRINVGLSQKGKSDLAERIFYKGTQKNNRDIPIYIGKDILSGGYGLNVKDQQYLVYNYKNILHPNEITYYNKELMDKDVKIIWRQTAPYFIGCILNGSMWFCNTIQGGYMKDSHAENISPYYLLSLLNSKYLRYLYAQNVKENGRVFPQVKLEKLRTLPIKIINLSEQEPFIGMSLCISNIKHSNPTADTSELETQIDQMVYGLYGLTDEEIKIVEESI